MSKDPSFECIHKASKCTVDVIFVHGLTGDPQSTWFCEETSEFWPNWLKEEFDTVSIYSLGFPASLFERWAKKEMDMFERAGNVLERFVGLGIGERPIAFITHSLGGILTKILLRKSCETEDQDWQNVANTTELVVFLSTPHLGAALANALSVLPNSSKHIELLANETGFLDDLNHHYRAYANSSKQLGSGLIKLTP